MPHLLYVAFWYPPSRASGVYRALATTSAFVDRGWDVTVLTTTREFLEDEVGSVDLALLDDVPATVDLRRVPFSFTDLEGWDVRSLGWAVAHFPRLGRNRSATFPDRYWRWIDRALRAAADVNSQKSVDHILATGNPYAAMEAARLTGADLGAGYSVDFRDPWAIDVYTGEQLGGAIAEAEQTIVGDADAIFHVNDQIAGAYRSRYPVAGVEKHHVAPNGYDADSLGEIGPPPRAGEPLRFAILGTITELWPIQAVFDGWSAARDDLPHGSELILGGHLGYFERSQSTIEGMIPGAGSGVRYVGPIAKRDVGEFYRGSHVVVVPVPGGAMVTSGKIYETLAVGVPVVCVQQDPGAARDLALGYDHAFVAEPSAGSVASALVAACQMATRQTVGDKRAIRERMAGHERIAAIQPIVEVISSRVESSR